MPDSPMTKKSKRVADPAKARAEWDRWRRAARVRKGLSPEPQQINKGPEHRKARLKAWRERTGAHRKYKLAKYGLTPASFASMVEQQDGKCAICQRPFAEDYKADPLVYPRVDHDHATGKVRELLCYWCNVAIGHFGENVEVLRRAADYLERHK